MYNNNQLYNSNLHGNRSETVDALLKGLGAEPLFSSINDPPPGIPTPLNNNYKQSPVTYNATQPDAFSEAFFSLLQRINQQNTQNAPNTQNLQNLPNMQSIQSPQHAQSSQIFAQGLQQNQQLGPLNQVGLPNPISILNEMHQRNRRSNIQPKYSFTMDSATGHFYCQLEFFGKIFRSERPTLRKQQAKEDVALIALRNLVSENSSSDSNRKVIGSDIMKLYDSSFNRLDNTSKSELWYKKQMSDFPGKQPRVILLEFCQMHKLPSPAYQPYNDYSGNTYFECLIGDRCFKSDKSFIRSSEAKDYVADVAFGAIYKEFCDRERGNDVEPSLFSSNFNPVVSNPPHSHFGSSLDSSHSNVTSSYTNFGPTSSIIDPGHLSTNNTHSNAANPGHLYMSSPRSNIIDPHSNMSSPHSGITNQSNSLSSSMSGSMNSSMSGSMSNSMSNSMSSSMSNSTTSLGHLNMRSQNSSVTPNLSMGLHSNINNSFMNMNNPSSQQMSNITSPHLPNSNVNNSLGSSHLNEITSSLVLPPNFSHEAPIKIDDANPLSPSIEPTMVKTEEGNMRDQLQASPISYHPYRAPGRERFPQNQTFNNNNLNQFAKKNSGFCKKFTSLLYEMAQSRRWSPPEFKFENGISGFVCTCSIQDYLFRGKLFTRKNDAKESAAEEAYRFLTRNGG